MRVRRARILALWAGVLVAALVIVAEARYITDLSAFLPANPTRLQKLLVDQLREGPASRLILVALEGDDPKARARIAAAMTERLRRDGEFSLVDDGEAASADRDREFLYRYRYMLSDAVTAPHFSVDGLRTAIMDTVENLASSAGLLLKSLVPHDPTGELLRIIDRVSHTHGPRTDNGIWISADGVRTLLVAQTAAPGSDTDAQERALAAIRRAFEASTTGSSSPAPNAQFEARTTGSSSPTPGTRPPSVQLNMSGPGVFAVAARAKIKGAAMRLSIVSSILVIGVLLAVYRSVAALILGLLPVASGALVGIAAVALGFGAVHGITLGFGITLIGESVDYSIYFFIQSLQREAAGSANAWQQRLWPTIRLGMLTSVCGFASLLPSGFPGLAQLGLYSISGLIVAALVTRFVLPELLPHDFKIRDLTPVGIRIGRLRDAARRHRSAVTAAGWLIASAAMILLYLHRDTVWNRELSALSPVSPAEQRYDALLRADLGTANVLDIVVVSGSTLEGVLRGAENAGAVLQPLVDANVIGDFDSPAAYLPSVATQRARRAALPTSQVLRDNLHRAIADLDLEEDRLKPFIDDVETARNGPFVTEQDLRGTSLAAGFAALIIRQSDRWNALLPLHAPAARSADDTARVAGDVAPRAAATPANFNVAHGSAALAAVQPPDIDVARVSAALAAAKLPDTEVLDLKAQTDALYADYLSEAIRLSLAGFMLIVLLLGITLRSAARTLRVLVPLVLAVGTVAAGLCACGQQLTILHLVGMLLIVAVGSNYALFFDRENAPAPTADAAPLTLASLLIANMSTVIGFGLLSFSQVPVLEALGMTVAPGAFLALVFSALLTSRAAPVEPAAILQGGLGA